MTPAPAAGLETQKPQLEDGLPSGPPTEELYSNKELPPFVELAASFTSGNSRPQLTDKQLASKVNSFHADPNNKSTQTVASYGFEVAMERLAEYPETRAEMLSKALAASMLDGWRPINDREKGLLTSWISELSAVAPYLEVERELSSYLMETENFGPGELELHLENEMTSARLEAELKEELSNVVTGNDYQSTTEQLAVIIKLDTRVQGTVELSVAA